jgi:hypothetical protein
VHRPRVGGDPISDPVLDVLSPLLSVLHERGVRDRRPDELPTPRLPPFSDVVATLRLLPNGVEWSGLGFEDVGPGEFREGAALDAR